jgi:hypothetical protein
MSAGMSRVRIGQQRLASLARKEKILLILPNHVSPVKHRFRLHAFTGFTRFRHDLHDVPQNANLVQLSRPPLVLRS